MWGSVIGVIQGDTRSFYDETYGDPEPDIIQTLNCVSPWEPQLLCGPGISYSLIPVKLKALVTFLNLSPLNFTHTCGALKYHDCCSYHERSIRVNHILT